MVSTIFEPLSYEYMRHAILAGTLVGAVCAMLSAFLVLKGWSLIGDALSHAVVPGVAGAYLLGLPYLAGALLSGLLAALSMSLIRSLSRLKEDAVIGLVFSTFFSAGLLLISLYPTSINIQSIILGNILAIGYNDLIQITIVCTISFLILGLNWKNFMLLFFDEIQTSAAGLPVTRLKILFFSLLSACVVACLQTVGAILVIALVITPGATAYLLTDRFSRMLIIAMAIGGVSCASGIYLSYFIDTVTGGLVVLIQSTCFAVAFLFSPKYGRLSTYRKQKKPHDIMKRRGASR